LIAKPRDFENAWFRNRCKPHRLVTFLV
jgi:hypothetical protein